MSTDEIPPLPPLESLSTERLWEYVEALRGPLRRERERGSGLRALLSYSSLIQEIAQRVRYADPDEKPDRWAFTFNDEMWPQEFSDFSSKEAALEEAAAYVEEYDIGVEDFVYVTKQIDATDRLNQLLDKRGYVIDASQLVHETIAELLELPEEWEVGKDDIADLDKRLAETVKAWADDKGPLGNWWVHDERPRGEEWIYFWDGKRFRPKSELERWRKGDDGDQG